MKRFALIMVGVLLVSSLAMADEQKATQQEEKGKQVVVSFNLLGPIVGLYSGEVEIAVGDKISVAVSPFYLNLRLGLTGKMMDSLGSDFQVWSVGTSAGINYYFLKKAPTGLYAGAFAGAAYMFVGTHATNAKGVLVSGGIQAGYRWIWGMLSLTPAVGVTYSTALFDFSSLGLPPSAAGNGLKLSWGVQVGLAF